jgi:hypothetical protein
MSACESWSGCTVKKKTDIEVINATKRIVNATEREKGLATGDSRVLKTITNTRSTDSPLMLLAHLFKDLANAIRGSKQKKTINRGKMSANRTEITAQAIERNNLDLGSRLCMTDSLRVYWKTSRKPSRLTIPDLQAFR